MTGPGTFPGLDEAEAQARLARVGPNELAARGRQGLLTVVAEVATEPMLLLLLAAGAIYLALGAARDALLLLLAVLVVIAIELSQRRKSDRALAALRDLSSPRALVIRAGQERRVAARELVPGDVVVVSEGDRVPADCVLLDTLHLAVDESLLTGESLAVRKVPWRAGPVWGPPAGEATPFLFAGTLVTRGTGVARVERTGMGTEMGRIGTRLETIETEETPLRRETRRVVRIFAALGVGVCTAVAVLYAAAVGDWLRGVLAGISLAIALTPEEFPVVLAVFLALGALRMSRKQVLTRQAQAIETLGAATVLCVDKTGTLTLNDMAVARLVANGLSHAVAPEGGAPLAEPFHELTEFLLLASQRDPFDPMELAITRYAHRELAGTEHLHASWLPVREYPLSERLLAVCHVWRAPDAPDYVVAAKGAPEAIADLCHLDAPVTTALATQVARLADDGLRVLAVARARFSAPALLVEQHRLRIRASASWGLPICSARGVPGAVRSRGRRDPGRDDHRGLRGDSPRRPSRGAGRAGARGHWARARRDGRARAARLRARLTCSRAFCPEQKPGSSRP
ncbi:MAG: HAD-IC family P-type ATPase [Candidatus Binatia bacterium]